MATPPEQQLSAIDWAAMAESYIQNEIARSPFQNLLRRHGRYPDQREPVFRIGTRHDRFWRRYQMEKEAGGKFVELKFSRTIVVRD